MVAQKKEKSLSENSDVLSGMKSICKYLDGVSETTALKWYREYEMPIQKRNGIWVGSKKEIEKWNQEKIKK